MEHPSQPPQRELPAGVLTELHPPRDHRWAGLVYSSGESLYTGGTLPAEPTFSPKLGDLGILELPVTSPPDPALLDPLPSLDPPTDRKLIRARDTAASTPERGVFHVMGVVGAATALVALELQRHRRGPVVCVAEDSEGAHKLAADLAFLLGQAEPGMATGEVLLLPPYENTPYAEVNPDRRAMLGRLATLSHLALKRPFRFLVVTAASLVRKVLPPEYVARQTRRVEVESEGERDEVVRALIQGGYIRTPVVEDPGTFAVRGALLDVWPPSSPEPVRMEFYGDLVLSIKAFEPESQRTTQDVAEVTLAPVREGIATEVTATRVKSVLHDLCDAYQWPTSKIRTLVEDVLSGRPFFGSDGLLPAFTELTSILDYVAVDVPLVLEDPAALVRAIREELGRAMADEEMRLSVPHFPRDAFYFSEFDLAEQLQQRGILCLHRGGVAGGDEAEDLEALESVPEDAPTLDARGHEDLERAGKQARKEHGKAGTLEPLVRRIHAWTEAGLVVVLSARAETQAERLTALLRHAGVSCRNRVGSFALEWLQEPASQGVAQVVVGPLSRGAVLPGEGLVLVTEEEVFGSRAHRATRRERKGKEKTKAFLEDLRALEVGDLVVHSEHGVGRYQGLVHREVNGHTVDLLVVEYSGGDRLYLPVYRLNQIQKFSGTEGVPRLDKLGGSTFAKTKAKAEKQARQMADELLRLYAERQSIPGHALPEAGDDYAAFEATFPFDETPDQARAIQDVLNDLESPRPMDRLVCGDVGFGKTEVAIRAAFRVAMAGRQVAVLCPTTVLAQQHFLNFQARYRDYPIRVGVLSRFQTKGEIDGVLRQVKEGSLDVVVGTHRLLSKDVHFKNLGLLVVDEEQRFGVAHKERIKQLRRNIDVLTLSATPIPRTLQMAVTGLRDMSLITTPPVDRRAIRTIVTRFDDQVVREAVRRELGRGGQVFYVYNRVEGLYERAAKLQQLVPEARIAIAHGQMSEVALEQAMLDFVEGKFDVLCATAIIESGLDIPRANTILIDRADLFGLAQLYQLRGRVGRSRERAFCYLIVPPASAMTDEARARIEALERHTELGSGFQVASLDLELRGGGDLLGAEQSGMVASVGFDLFCQMLQDAVRQLRGEEVVTEVEPDLNFDVEALLPEQYIDEVGVRLSFYKRLASADDEAEVQEIAAEMEDRFGPPPREAKNLVTQMRIKVELRRLRVLGCDASARAVTLHLREDTPLDPAKVMALIQKKGSPYRMTPDMKLTRRFSDEQVDGLQNAEMVLQDLAACLR
ncbi:MAG: transcription-repair coupling factor [Polyangiaceae bacterium]|nr:transcription-repair coupling factor [Polyangiaceae bacterium]